MILYILINDGGDGSYYPHYCVEGPVIERLQEAYDNGLMDYPDGVGVDGDGFHYSRVNVQDTWVEDNPDKRLIDMAYANSFFFK